MVFRHFKKLLLVFLLSASGVETGYTQPPSIQFVNEGKTNMKGGFSLYRNKGAKITADSAFSLYQSGRFQLNENNIINAFYSSDILWIGSSLQNTGSKPAVLLYEVTDPSIDELELFIVSENKISSLGQTGDLFAFDSRPVHHKSFVFRINIPLGDRVHLLLSINNNGHPIVTKINLEDEKSFQKRSAISYTIWGIAIGILVFVILFSLFIFWSLRERLYLFYALYVFFVLLWILCNNGMSYQYLWGNHPQIMARARFMTGEASIILLVQLMQLFLNQSKINSRFYAATNFIKLALLAFVCILFIPYDFSKDKLIITTFLITVDLLTLAAVAVVILGLVEKIRQGSRIALYFLLATLISFPGIILVFLVRLNVIGASNITFNGVYIGVFLEIVVLTIGLTQRYNLYKKEREKLLLELKQQEMEAAIKVALAKEDERRRIAADMHDDLGAGLSGLRIMSELAARKESKEDLQKDAGRIAAAASDLGGKMKDIIWTLNTENDTLQNLLYYIHQYGENLFRDAGIQFKMQLPEQIKGKVVSGEWRRHMFLAVKEAFNNIVKHSGATMAECFIKAGDNFQMEIRDNGRGFSSPDINAGNGLHNMKIRLDTLGGSFTIDSTNGTSLRFVAPFGK